MTEPNYLQFEKDLASIFPKKPDDDFNTEVWSALANVDWEHKDHGIVGYSFRAAGGLIAEIIGEGDYMDWYCCGPYAEVSWRIERSLGKLGWTYKIDEETL